MPGKARRAAGYFLEGVNLRRPLRSRYRQLLGALKDLGWKLADKNLKAPDGLPYPPPSLCYPVTASYNPLHYWSSGKAGAKAIEDILTRNGLSMDDHQSVLDFGCGCGRLLRHLNKHENLSLIGTDINCELVEWCSNNLQTASFSCNELASPLPYPDCTFDLVYAVAVFGHMREEHQVFSLKELGRILKPGGYLLATTKGRDRINELTPEQAEDFIGGRSVVVEPDYSGANYCLAYHSEECFRTALVRWALCEPVFFETSGSPDTGQDVHLSRRT